MLKTIMRFVNMKNIFVQAFLLYALVKSRNCQVSAQTICADEPGFTFNLLVNNREVTCNWIVDSTFTGVLAARKQTYCDNNDTVRSKCKQSCGACGTIGPSFLPTQRPAPTQSPAPTKSPAPSKSPTYSPTKSPAISVHPTNMDFGSDFQVEFFKHSPNRYNFIGIYSRDDDGGNPKALLSSDLCGRKWKGGKKGSKGGKGKGGNSSKKSKEECTPSQSGTIDFSISGPDLNAYNHMPLNPGKYKACLMEYKYTSIVCTKFVIDDIGPWLIKRTVLTPNSSEFGYGQGASVSFTRKGRALLPVNAWIGVYDANLVNNDSSELPRDTYAWAYAGCNNKNGNEQEQKACSIRTRSGTVDNFYGLIPVGTYRFCLSFYSNRPYEAFKCSSGTFTVVAPELEIASSFPFGSDIEVKFTNRFPSTLNWVAVLGDTQGKKKKEELWASMCGDHDSWNKSCPQKYNGTITFSGRDPDQESYKKWPINPGPKTVCMYGGKNYGGKDDYLELVCQDFTVDEIPEAVLSGTSVTLSSDRFNYSEAIIARFDTPVAYPNTWIGIYDASDIFWSISKLPNQKPNIWVYSSCDNKEGDQVESDSCELKKESGDVHIGKIQDTYWPISPGTYKMCMSLYNNPPFAKFVCSEDSFFVEPEECKDNPNFTFTLRDGVTNVKCSWIDEEGISTTQREHRLSTWCGEESKVLDECRASCDKCPECKDDETYKWKVYDGTLHGCGYINADGLTADQINFRMKRWCSASVGDNKLLQCPKTCGECTVPTPHPTMAPTEAPSEAPSPLSTA